MRTGRARNPQLLTLEPLIRTFDKDASMPLFLDNTCLRPSRAAHYPLLAQPLSSTAPAKETDPSELPKMVTLFFLVACRRACPKARGWADRALYPACLSFMVNYKLLYLIIFFKHSGLFTGLGISPALATSTVFRLATPPANS